MACHSITHKLPLFFLYCPLFFFGASQILSCLFCFLHLRQIKIPEIKEEIPSEDIKPEDSSAQSLPIKKEPLVQATLSTMFKKAEEKKVKVQTLIVFSVTKKRFIRICECTC
jgi:hypothetical protein